jgi:CBS domain-containing protein
MYEFLEEIVGNNMTSAVRSVTPETRLGDLYRLFAADNFEAYPVVREDTLVGIVSKLDALKPLAFARDRLLPHYEEGMSTTVDEIMSTEVVLVHSDTRLERVLELMINHRVKSLPVVDQWQGLVGIIALEDVMRAMERSVLWQYPPVLPFATA